MHFNRIEKNLFMDQIGTTKEVGYICGGPCMCFSKGNPWRLTLQDLIDCLIPCLGAINYSVPVYLYFQSYESDFMADVLVFDIKKADYASMKKFLLNGLKAVLQLLKYPEPEIFIIDTKQESIKNVIDRLEKKLEEKIVSESLFGLYSSKNKENYPQGKDEEQLMLQVYRRNLSLYFNNFFDQIFEFKKENRVTIENLTQKKALNLAGIGSDQKNTSAFLYPPAPNCKNLEMNLGNRNHKIDLRLNELQIKQRVKKLFTENPSAKNYYDIIFPQIPIETIMKTWKAACLS